MTRHEEWHVTVKDANPMDWWNFCNDVGLKPLYIELSDMRLQLMCASATNPHELIIQGGYHPLRVKREVSMLLAGEEALYWEAHYKLDGPYLNTRIASRDLYRNNRWYLTQRCKTPPALINENRLKGFLLGVAAMKESWPAWSVKDITFGGVEYEACLLDTNPDLDKGWL